jgi:putative salt-induced outer membrane protein YdiY
MKRLFVATVVLGIAFAAAAARAPAPAYGGWPYTNSGAAGSEIHRLPDADTWWFPAIDGPALAPEQGESIPAPASGDEPESSLPMPAVVSEAAADVPFDAVKPPPSPWDLWDGSVEVGLNGTGGNSETFNLHFAAKAEHKTPAVIHTYETKVVEKSNGPKKTASNATLDARTRWPFPDTPWSYYIHGALEYDEFKAFNVRSTADTGVGYEFLGGEVTSLLGRLGASVSRELGGPDERHIPELVTGLEWKHSFNPLQTVSASAEYFADVTDFGDYRVNSKAAWEILVDPLWGLSLKLAVTDRYDSTPNGSKRNDLDYSLLLKWKF